MGRPLGPKQVHRYSNEFKVTALTLSRMLAAVSPIR